MAIISTKAIQPIAALAAALLGGLVAVMAPAQADEGVPSPLNGLKGKKLEIVWSGNDPLCKKLFDFYDKRYDPESSEVFHEEDPIFLRWNRVTHYRGHPTEWAEADIDNDGQVELLTRSHFQKHAEHDSLIGVHKNLSVEDFMNYTSGVGLYQIIHADSENGFVIEFRTAPKPKPINYKAVYYPLRNYPESAPRKSPFKPYYEHFGRLSLINYGGMIFVMAYHSIDMTMGHSIWGMLVKIEPDRIADDICYFDRRNRDRK